MGCESRGNMIVCRRGGAVRCSVGGCLERQTKLCDWQIGPKTTCDAPLCFHHAGSVGPNRDYCPRHAEQRKQVNSR